MWSRFVKLGVGETGVITRIGKLGLLFRFQELKSIVLLLLLLLLLLFPLWFDLFLSHPHFLLVGLKRKRLIKLLNISKTTIVIDILVSETGILILIISQVLLVENLIIDNYAKLASMIARGQVLKYF